MDWFDRIRSGDSDEGESEASDSIDRDPKENLTVYMGNYDIEFPHNTEEAEEAWESETPNVSEDLLREYEGMNTGTAIGNLISNTRHLLNNADKDFSDKTISEALSSERDSLDSQIQNMKRELQLEENEEEEIDGWNIRVERFIAYIKYLHQELPDNLSQISPILPGNPTQTDSIQTNILLGGGKFGADPRDLPGQSNGLEFDVIDEMADKGITTESQSMKGQTYGAGHAIEDLQKLYSRNLSQFLENDEDELEKNVELLDDFSRNLRRTMRTFNSLMHVRVNLAQLEEEEDLEETLVRRFKSNDQMDTERVEKALLGELADERDAIESLETTSKKLMREEKWMVEHLEEAHDLLERMFRIEDGLAVEEENEFEKLEGVGGKMPVSDFLKKLENNATGTGKEYFEMLRKEYDKVVSAIKEIHDIEHQEINNIVRIGARIEKTLDIIGSEREIEREVEADIVDEVDKEAEIELKLNEVVEKYINNIYDEVRGNGNIALSDLFANFDDRKESFRESDDALMEHKDPDKELKDEEKIAERLEVIDEVFQKVQYQVEGKDGHPRLGTDVDIKVDHDSVDKEFNGKAEGVVKWCLSHLEEIDGAIDTQVGDNGKDYLELIADVREKLEKFKHIKRAALKAEEEKQALEDELNSFPEEYRSDGIEEFRDELGLINGPSVDELVEQFTDGGEAQELIEGAEYTLDNIDEDDTKELKAIKRAANIDGDLNERVESLISAARQEDSSTKMVEGLKKILEYVKDIHEEEDMLEKRVEREIDNIES
jgi:hypothetical protein